MKRIFSFLIVSFFIIILIIVINSANNYKNQIEAKELIPIEIINGLRATKKIVINDINSKQIIKTITADTEIENMITILSHAYYLTARVLVPINLEPLYSIEFRNENNDVIDIIFVSKTPSKNEGETIVNFNFENNDTIYFFNEQDGKHFNESIEK